MVVVNRNAEHPEAPETDKYVRGKILMGANIIQPIPGQPSRCRFSMVTQVRGGKRLLLPLIIRDMGNWMDQRRRGGENKCSFFPDVWTGWCMLQVDPGGFSPPSIVNKVTSLGPVNFIRDIEIACKRDPPIPGKAVSSMDGV